MDADVSQLAIHCCEYSEPSNGISEKVKQCEQFYIKVVHGFCMGSALAKHCSLRNTTVGETTVALAFHRLLKQKVLVFVNIYHVGDGKRSGKLQMPTMRQSW